MTTLAQDWINEGYQKGIHAGMQQGMQQGEHEKAIAIAKNMLDESANIDFIKKVTGLSDQELLKIRTAH